MPNYCGNRLTITGNIKEREEFVENHKNLNLEKLLPDLCDYRDVTLETKVEHSKEKTVFTFQTVWVPPSSEIMCELSSKFPKLTFDLRYVEKGFGFYGYWTKKTEDRWNFQNDDIVYEYDETEEESVPKGLRKGLSIYEELFHMSG